MCGCVSPEGDSGGCIRISSVEMHRAVLWECSGNESQKSQSGRDPLQLHQQIPGRYCMSLMQHHGFVLEVLLMQAYTEIHLTHLQTTHQGRSRGVASGAPALNVFSKAPNLLGRLYSLYSLQHAPFSRQREARYQIRLDRLLLIPNWEMLHTVIAFKRFF